MQALQGRQACCSCFKSNNSRSEQPRQIAVRAVQQHKQQAGLLSDVRQGVVNVLGGLAAATVLLGGADCSALAAEVNLTADPVVSSSMHCTWTGHPEWSTFPHLTWYSPKQQQALPCTRNPNYIS
jgi:hypothetical protein